MSVVRMIVLANSWKHGDWCLAGIDTATGKWVRPITDLDDGRIPKSSMKVGRHFPQLLDIWDVPLDETGPDFGFAAENKTILTGQWHLCGQVDVKYLLRYAERPYYILHNRRKFVTVEEMNRKPFERRTTLQFIHVSDFNVRDRRKTITEKHQWEGVVSSGGRQLGLSITDPVLFDKLSGGHMPSKSCLLTMSLGMPYKPSDWREDQPAACWKLIAGVVEL